eukprot:13812176-Ditylum_brightwellii.AAC.1
MESDTHCPEKAEKVDEILLDSSLAGEKACKHRKHSWWSLPLAKAQFRLNTLKAHLSRLRCGILEETSITKYGITVNCSSDKDIINKKYVKHAEILSSY